MMKRRKSLDGAIRARILKVYELSVSGVGGEQNVAKRLLTELLEKYDVSLKEVISDNYSSRRHEGDDAYDMSAHASEIMERLTMLHRRMHYSDSELLEMIVYEVEDFLFRENRELHHKKKAQLIRLLFEYCKDHEEMRDEK